MCGADIVCPFSGIVFSLKGEGTARLYLPNVSKVACPGETVKKVLLPRIGLRVAPRRQRLLGVNMSQVSLTLWCVHG